MVGLLELLDEIVDALGNNCDAGVHKSWLVSKASTRCLDPPRHPQPTTPTAVLEGFVLGLDRCRQRSEADVDEELPRPCLAIGAHVAQGVRVPRDVVELDKVLGDLEQNVMSRVLCPDDEENVLPIHLIYLRCLPISSP